MPGTSPTSLDDARDPTRAFETTLREIREDRRRRSRRRRTAAISIPVALVLLGGTFLLTQRNVTTTVSLEEAQAEFRATRPAGGGTLEGSEPARTSSEERVDPADAREPVPATTVAERSTPGAFDLLPAEGVYAYRATGGERISMFGASHEYPERVYATVRHLGGCRWEHRNDVIEEHVDERVLCNQGDTLLQLRQSRDVEFFGQRDGANMHCDPPALLHDARDEPGATSTAVCSDGDGNHARMKRTYIGVDPVSIGGRIVDAVHFRMDATFEGMATGTSEDLLWVSPETGMTLRWDRTVDTMADASFGASVRYQEEASFVLESLTPAT